MRLSRLSGLATLAAPSQNLEVKITNSGYKKL